MHFKCQRMFNGTVAVGIDVKEHIAIAKTPPICDIKVDQIAAFQRDVFANKCRDTIFIDTVDFNPKLISFGSFGDLI